MGKYIVKLSAEAEVDLKRIHKSGDRQAIRKIAKIFEEFKDTPSTGAGNPEVLKYKNAQIWSRRINKKDRLVYLIDEDSASVFVLSALGHYEDK